MSLPDVCTASPVRGKAFCANHCSLLEKEASEVPSGLKDFLFWCCRHINGRDRCGALNFGSTTQLATTYCFNLFRGNITGGSRGTSLSSVELPRIIPTKYPRLRIDT